MIKSINHVGISVANLEQSIKFYEEAFGMTTLLLVPFSGDQYEAILRLSGAQGRVALLRGKDNDFQLELFEFSSPAPEPSDPNRPVHNHGITHFCVEVADIDSEYERLTKVGVSFHNPPIRFVRSGNKATYGRDPDGNVFELWERAQLI